MRKEGDEGSFLKLETMYLLSKENTERIEYIKIESN